MLGIRPSKSLISKAVNGASWKWVSSGRAGEWNCYETDTDWTNSAQGLNKEAFYADIRSGKMNPNLQHATEYKSSVNHNINKQATILLYVSYWA